MPIDQSYESLPRVRMAEESGKKFISTKKYKLSKGVQAIESDRSRQNVSPSPYRQHERTFDARNNILAKGYGEGRNEILNRLVHEKHNHPTYIY